MSQAFPTAPSRRTTAPGAATEKRHVRETLRAAAEHPGAAFVEIYQNCNVFNDGAFAAIRGKGGAANQIRLEHGRPIRFGEDLEMGVVASIAGGLEIVEVAAAGQAGLVVHDAHVDDPSHATALARLADAPTGPTPIGVFRAVERPVYGSGRRGEHSAAANREDLDALLRDGDTWQV